jgi:hypothetical protein
MPATRPLSESDLANADLHVVAVLDILNERAPGYLTDKLIAVSDWCWSQRRLPAAADTALARIHARCAL